VLLDQNNETANMTILSSESLQFEFDNLIPFTRYSVTLFANTFVGAGMEATADFMTDIGSEFRVGEGGREKGREGGRKGM